MQSPPVQTQEEVSEHAAENNLPKQALVSDSASSERDPRPEFVAFVQKLEKKGWVPDTARLQEANIYPWLDKEGIDWFGAQPFYKIDLQQHPLFTWNTQAPESAILDTQLFNKAIRVWAYFYRKKSAEEIIPDGVIEQWQFENPALVDTALAKLNKNYPVPFFNTKPYYLKEGELLYVFSTRSMGLSYAQKEIFDDFRSEF